MLMSAWIQISTHAAILAHVTTQRVLLLASVRMDIWKPQVFVQVMFIHRTEVYFEKK